MNLDALIRFYETLTPDDVPRFIEHYREDARFKDPFNEVEGIDAIRRIFAHMFEQVDAPRFRVLERFTGHQGAMLLWEFDFRPRLLGRGVGPLHTLRGVSHLQFDGEGRVASHRDYWDTAEELYFRVPGLGLVLRGMRRALAA